MQSLTAHPPTASDPQHSPCDTPFGLAPNSDNDQDAVPYDWEFDAGLSPIERAASDAIIRMVAERLHPALIHDRWVDEDNWDRLKKVQFGHIPLPLFTFVTQEARKEALAALPNQSWGYRPGAEVLHQAGEDLDAVKALLGDQAFLFGARPVAADGALVPVLAAIAASPVSTPLSALVTDDSILTAYIERGRAAMCPEYASEQS